MIRHPPRSTLFPYTTFFRSIEIKPTATIAWREIRFGPVRRKGKPIPLVDCPEPIPVARAFGPDARAWRELGRPLEGVFIDVGERSEERRVGKECRSRWSPYH